jgi:hypothetical protein
LSETIQRFGCSVEYVSGTKERQPSFAYTIGLFAHGYPEWLVVGFGAQAACKVLNGMSGLTAAGTKMAPGTEVDVEHSYLLRRQVIVETCPTRADRAPGESLLRPDPRLGTATSMGTPAPGNVRGATGLPLVRGQEAMPFALGNPPKEEAGVRDQYYGKADDLDQPGVAGGIEGAVDVVQDVAPGVRLLPA